jgi:hypothetical protein
MPTPKTTRATISQTHHGIFDVDVAVSSDADFEVSVDVTVTVEGEGAEFAESTGILFNPGKFDRIPIFYIFKYNK